MGESTGFFNELANASEKDVNQSIIDSSQLFSSATVPFGVPSGIPKLDLAFGRPGWPAGRMSELYGFEGCGKTTLGLHAIANVQKLGGIGIFIDSEKTFDPHKADTVGVDQNYQDNFRRIEVRSLDAGFRAVQNICKSIKKSGMDRPMVVVYDSIQGAQNEYAMEQELGKEQRTGHEAKVIKEGLRAINTGLSETKIVLLLINHAIAKIVPMGRKSQAAGGHAPKLFSTCRVELVKIGDVKSADKKWRLGQKVKIRPEKNKVGELKIVDFDTELLDASGFDTINNLLESMIDVDMVTRVNIRTYRYDESGVEFAKNEFPKVIEQLGGLDTVYKAFYEHCYNTGHMRPYG